jgi:hypothetical protein
VIRSKLVVYFDCSLTIVELDRLGGKNKKYMTKRSIEVCLACSIVRKSHSWMIRLVIGILSLNIRAMLLDF